MLEVIEIKSIDELKQWKEQWQEDLSIDLSASSAFPANEWFNLNHQKRHVDYSARQLLIMRSCVG
ncbi:hypothetical protein GP2143_09725 [marine gamma proteobacterium HTCC2143]|uniref:Uncharacterized protein n=1 Tax=marine gamma proteobacterium HTCC2143 TaxID=247633 RepID=A0YFR1_9GAMM|nr:hypothetical protein GP2143_09725 [marine gamma proteobacterium HTCC2143]